MAMVVSNREGVIAGSMAFVITILRDVLACAGAMLLLILMTQSMTVWYWIRDVAVPWIGQRIPQPVKTLAAKIPKPPGLSELPKMSELTAKLPTLPKFGKKEKDPAASE